MCLGQARWFLFTGKNDQHVQVGFDQNGKRREQEANGEDHSVFQLEKNTGKGSESSFFSGKTVSLGRTILFVFIELLTLMWL